VVFPFFNLKMWEFEDLASLYSGFALE